MFGNDARESAFNKILKRFKRLQRVSVFFFFFLFFFWRVEKHLPPKKTMTTKGAWRTCS